MAQPQMQFQTVAYPHSKGKSHRIMWSDDGGVTWHEPEEATLEVARAWQALRERTGK